MVGACTHNPSTPTLCSSTTQPYLSESLDLGPMELRDAPLRGLHFQRLWRDIAKKTRMFEETFILNKLNINHVLPNNYSALYDPRHFLSLHMLKVVLRVSRTSDSVTFPPASDTALRSLLKIKIMPLPRFLYSSQSYQSFVQKPQSQ